MTACRPPTSTTLSAWFRRGADRKCLELYLETFAHTFGVMQERDAIVRVAAECAEDLAADGVVYAEVRMAPELSTERGLTLDEVVEANLEGFRVGSAQAAAAGHPIVMKLLVTAMRQAARSVEVAECAVRWRDAGVVGFDIAGPEAGYRADPPPRRVRATSAARTSTSRSTPASRSGCRRSGRRSSSAAPSAWATASGSWTTSPSATTASVELGRLAAFVRDRRVPARDVPDLQRPHRRRGVDRRAPDRPAPSPALPGHAQHRQPADERRLALERVRRPRRGVRDRPGRDGVADDQRA